MGCVGSKKEQDAVGKALGSEDSSNRTLPPHYVKDPTAGTKAVSKKGQGSDLWK